MVFCQECGAENINNAKFCNECMAKLTPKNKKNIKNVSDVKNWWKTLSNNEQVILGLISGFVFITFLLVVLVSIQSTNTVKSNLDLSMPATKNITYSDGSVTFIYPDNYQNTTPRKDIIQGHVGWFNNLYAIDPKSGDTIYLNYNKELGSENPKEFAICDSVYGPNAGMPNINTFTNDNNVEMSKSAFKIGSYMYINYFFKDNDKVMYQLVFITTPENILYTNQVAERIINSLKLIQHKH